MHKLCKTCCCCFSSLLVVINSLWFLKIRRFGFVFGFLVFGYTLYGTLWSGNCQLHKICQKKKTYIYLFFRERERKVALRGVGRRGGEGSFSISYCMHFIFTVSPADFPQFSWLPIYPIMIMSVLGHLLVLPYGLTEQPSSSDTSTNRSSYNYSNSYLYMISFLFLLPLASFPPLVARIHPIPLPESRL